MKWRSRKLNCLVKIERIERIENCAYGRRKNIEITGMEKT